MTNFTQKINNVERIYHLLQDEESRQIFEIRYNYMISRDLNKLCKDIDGLEIDYECLEWEQYICRKNSSKLVIFGAGTDGMRTYRILNRIGYADRIVAFCDNNYESYKNQRVCGKEVLSLDEVAEKFEDVIFVLATRKYWAKIYQQLIIFGIDRENIFVPSHGILVALKKDQYFDLPQLKRNTEEVFIDAGAFDGETSNMFAEWANRKYQKIYMFEPNPRFEAKCKKTIEKRRLFNVEFVSKGTSDKNEVLYFMSDELAGSRVNKAGETKVELTKIDEILAGRPATFMKFDVEGSEEKSLLGAKETIQKYHPNLAVCVYHKPDDIVTIPQCILDIEAGYRFYLRHYTSCEWETVLYAVHD